MSEFHNALSSRETAAGCAGEKKPTFEGRFLPSKGTIDVETTICTHPLPVGCRSMIALRDDGPMTAAFQSGERERIGSAWSCSSIHAWASRPA